jgi:Ca2+-binding RTX toxin-like protein
MNTRTTRTTTAVLCAGVAILVGGAASAGADEPLETAQCHGLQATYVGTGGDDVISDETTDYGRNPVFVLGDGNDDVQLGLSYGARLDSLTVCGGSGNDSIEIYESVGDHAEILLDGGLDDDFVGNNGDLRYSDLARLTLIGGDGNDVLRGGNSNDSIDAGRGNDSAYGLGGIDTINGGTGDDQVHGQRGSDRMIGGSGADYLDGDMPGYPDGKDIANGGGDRDRCEAEVQHSCES